MKNFFAFSVLALSCILVACGKKEEAPAQPATNTTSGNPLEAPGNYVGALVKGQNAAIKTVDNASINSAISQFYAVEGRFPKDLNELVAKKYLSKVPEAPHGMKIVYDAGAGTAKVVKE